MKMNLLNYNTKEEDFYKNYFYFSFSSISKLLHHPFVFYNHYVLKQREDSSAAHLLEGKLVHCLLLEENNFDNEFVILPGSLPTESNKKIINELYKSIKGDIKFDLSYYDTELLALMKSHDLYQNLTDDKKDKTLTGDQKRSNKFLTQKNKEYFKYLIESDNKTIIDQTVYDKCFRAVGKLKENKEVLELIGHETDCEFIDVINEEFFETKNTGYSFGFKGFIDNLVIDYPKKEVRINDLKTTSKDLINFTDSIDYYRYWIQACVYTKLVEEFLKEKGIELKDWKITFSFVVIDKYNSIYPFEVSEDTLNKWMLDFEEVLKKVEYHYSNKKYGLPYELETQRVTI